MSVPYRSPPYRSPPYRSPSLIGALGGKAPGGIAQTTGWSLFGNENNNNSQWGIFVTGGASRNTLANNRGSGTLVDLKLNGDSGGSVENIVAQGADHPLTVQDCGIDNIVSGNVTMADNCP